MTRHAPQLLMLLLVLTTAGSALADSRIDLTPSAAFFNPTQNVVDQNGTTARFAGAAGWGGRLSIWLNDRVMLEGGAHYGRSSLDTEFDGSAVGSVDLALFYGSAQIAVALGEEKRLMLHGGIGLQGTNYDEFVEGGNILTGVFGISSTMPLSDTTSLRADLDVHTYTTYFEIGDSRTDEMPQVDLVLAVGIQFSAGGK